MAKAAAAITAMIEAFSEQLITIDELRARMPDLRARETNLRGQIAALDTQLADRDAYLKLADDLEGFLAQLRGNATTATTRNASACCGCSSKTSSSDPRRSPSATASPPGNAPPRAATKNPPTRRVTIGRVIHCVGGVISPVLCNVYLHLARPGMGRAGRGPGALCRRRDGHVLVPQPGRAGAGAPDRPAGRSRPGAEGGQDPDRAPGRGRRGLDFLGFHHRLVRSRGLNGKKPVTFLARWPADKAMQRARDRIRELTRRSRTPLPVKWIVEDLNRFLGGWAAFFRFGNSAARFCKIRNYARMRLALFISKRLRRSRGFGWSVVTYQSPNQLGLVTLSGIVVDPRPFRDWRGRPMQAVNGVGEPCAGEPHARFEAAGAGNGADLTRSTEVAQPAGKPAEHEGLRLYRQRATAPAPDPT